MTQYKNSIQTSKEISKQTSLNITQLIINSPELDRMAIHDANIHCYKALDDLKNGKKDHSQVISIMTWYIFVAEHYETEPDTIIMSYLKKHAPHTLTYQGNTDWLFANHGDAHTHNFDKNCDVHTSFYETRAQSFLHLARNIKIRELTHAREKTETLIHNINLLQEHGKHNDISIPLQEQFNNWSTEYSLYIEKHNDETSKNFNDLLYFEQRFAFLMTDAITTKKISTNHFDKNKHEITTTQPCYTTPSLNFSTLLENIISPK